MRIMDLSEYSELIFDDSDVTRVDYACEPLDPSEWLSVDMQLEARAALPYAATVAVSLT